MNSKDIKTVKNVELALRDTLDDARKLISFISLTRMNLVKPNSMHLILAGSTKELTCEYSLS